MNSPDVLTPAALAVPEPAFDPSSRWNAWGCALVCAACFVILVFAQAIAFFAILALHYPGILSGALPESVLGELRTAAGLAQLLNAPTFFSFTVFSYGLLVLAIFLGARIGFGANAAQLGLRIRPHAKQIGYGILAGIGLIVISIVIGGVESKLFGPHPQLVAEMLAKRHGPFAFALDLLSVSLAAPIGEELFFRGVLFAGLVQRMPLWSAAVLSGLIFGAAHLDPWNFPSLFVIGIGLAYVYYANRTLWSNIASHATVNGVTLILTYLAPQLVK